MYSPCGEDDLLGYLSFIRGALMNEGDADSRQLAIITAFADNAGDMCGDENR